MTIDAIKNLFQDRQRRNVTIISFLLGLTVTTIVVDFLEATFNHSSFYISESLLFSSFWVLFFPLLNIQINFAKRRESISANSSTAIALILVHLTVYPVLVWLLSRAFYYHTFSYWQTFQFGITAHFFKATLLYTVPVFFVLLLKQKNKTITSTIDKATERSSNFLLSMIITDTHNQKLSIKTEDIFYFSANPPYINIYHKTKKHLHYGTLKSLTTQLNHNQFVRIHKSFIVNILFVASYKSRLNGDYDLTLKDGTELRVSRNYASTFKTIFENSHHLTTE